MASSETVFNDLENWKNAETHIKSLCFEIQNLRVEISNLKF
jgi:hypothetical protein